MKSLILVSSSLVILILLPSTFGVLLSDSHDDTTHLPLNDESLMDTATDSNLPHIELNDESTMGPLNDEESQDICGEKILVGSVDDMDDHHRKGCLRQLIMSRVRRRESSAAKFQKLMFLVKASKLQDCAGRVVCHLNCSPDAFGSDGKRVLSNLQKLRASGIITPEEMDFYEKASSAGLKLKKSKACESCYKSYPNCPAEVADMVAVASLIKLTS